MNILTNKFLHLALKLINRRPYQRFINGMKNTKEYQQKNLFQTIEILKDIELHQSKLTNIKTYEEFKNLPITSYQDYKEDIESFKSNKELTFCNDIVRFQPTSGSTSLIKWIPYNQNLLDQFDEAASIWLADLANQYPQILKGKHYWSLSWLPNSLRKQQKIDDSEILSPLKRFFMRRVFAVPNEVMFTETIEENIFSTACFLCASSDLTLVSIWSPTFLISILEVIQDQKEEISEVLKTGEWPIHYPIDVQAPKNISQSLKLNGKINYQTLWPKLALISCWDTSQSKLYANKLKKNFPNTDFQGKGLWATEGVVTLPIGDEYLLSYQSHFYEFQDTKTNKVFPSWELTPGMEVSPILTTPNGLLRYKLNDRLLVTGHRETCPVLVFKGRINDTDLVGEKLSHSIVEDIFGKLKDLATPISLIGIHDPINGSSPYYLLLANEANQDCEKLLEEKLCESYHYKLARDLKQLGAAKVFATQKALEIYEQICLNKGMIKGNIKIDPLITIESDEYIYDYK